ncbi:MAG: hypothetical protein R3D71_07955 [Rickettsiales bacterium]
MQQAILMCCGYKNMNYDNFIYFIGTWKYSPPWDGSDDFMSEYEISGSFDDPVVKAKDLYDGEEFIISNIKWDGFILEFESLMKSTGRKGINKLTLDHEGQLNNEFTFTESNKLTKTM